MSKSLGLAILSAMLFVLAPASAHERQMECSDVGMQEIKADMQAMQNGEAKTNAMNHMKMAEEAKAKHDMEGCMTHMQAAMEAMEK